MLASVPDTPYGHALGRFLLFFEQSPLDLQAAHAAFTDLSVVAAREHPQMAWPLAVPREGEAPFLITVDGLLAAKWARYAAFPTADAATVEAALAPWTGATVRSVQAHCFHQAGRTSSVFHLALKTVAGQAQGFTAYCPWQLTSARAAPVQWNDAAPSPDQALARLRRARVQRVAVSSVGALQLTFTNGAYLEVGSAGWQPNEQVADLHYFLQTEDQLFWRVASQFRIQPLTQEEDIG
ncbi:hypothetical protein [Hymenobacter terricola]|uniref:hypothetical protein n=1 Tax=Hymenobacter terricola TaxID=2819236 RepID=UPI001B3100C6|nr:hypothetical protein [Hymenobacter terricola]